jgi:uncharacterized protein
MKYTHTFRVVVAGPFAVGKTTFLHQISMAPVVGVDVPTSGDDATVKNMTTVGIEYGLYIVEDDEFDIELLLFATPGQERFESVRAVAASSMDALILLVDANEPATWPDAARILKTSRAQRPTPTVVGLNRSDPNAPPSPELRQILELEETIPVVPCQIVNRESAVALLIRTLNELMYQPANLGGLT